MLKVLLVDPDEARAADIAANLAADGCQVVAIVREPTDLVRLVREQGADVIVCDIDAPSRDALESMQALHRDEPRPVVMFVDRSDPAALEAAVQAGVAAYVIEGLAASRVRGVIDVAIAQFRAHQKIRAELAEARSALTERKLVERAKGILMATRGLNEEEAFRSLRRLAMDQGRRLAEVADSVIALESMLGTQKKPKR